MNIITSALSALGFDFQVAIANLINFAIIFFLLNKYLFPKIRTVIEERKKTIAEGITNSELAKKQLLTAEQEKSGILERAQEEAREIRVEAMKQKHERLMDIEAESAVAIANAKHILALELEIDRKADNDEFAHSAAEAFSLAVDKIVGEKLQDPKMAREYILGLLH